MVYTFLAPRVLCTISASILLVFSAGCALEKIPVLTALPEATLTTLTVSSSGSVVSAAPSGTVITLTATVVAGAVPVARGTVNFCEDGPLSCTDIHLLGTAQITGDGNAVLHLRPGIGNHTYKAVFAGTIHDAASTSNLPALSVTGLYQTDTLFTDSGQAGDYTLTASVLSAAPSAPTGKVSFLDVTNSSVLLGTAPLTPEPRFTPLAFNAMAAGTDTRLLQLADLNGDGSLDALIVTHDAPQDDYKLLAFLGNGDGTFNPSPTRTEIDRPSDLVIGDFNNDGIPDVALVRADSGVAVLLGNGDGSFQPERVSASAVQGSAFAMADFNRDGDIDLLVADKSGSITSLSGNGDGTFQVGKTSPAFGENVFALAVADLNADGYSDVVAVNQDGSKVYVLLGNDRGVFRAGPSTSLAAAGSANQASPVFLATGLFNGDQTLDVAVLKGNSLSLLAGKGDGSFASPSTLAVNGPASGLSVEDFDQDGHFDLAVSGAGLQILFGKGDGTFNSVAYPEASGTGLSTTGDLDSDGFPDLLLANAAGVAGATPYLSRNQLSVATLSDVSPVGTGVRSVVASYPDNQTFAASRSSDITLSAKMLETSLKLTASPAPSTYGQQVVLTAALSPYASQDQSTDKETISFFYGKTLLGTGTLVNGSASFTTTSLPAGSDSLTATFQGDTSFTSAGSNAFVLAVNKAVLTVAPHPPQPGQQTFSVGYGNNTPIPSDLYVITGFVNGDTAAVISGAPTVTPQWGTQPGVGTYPLAIGAGSLSAANYSFTTVNGNISVVPALIAVKANPAAFKYGSPLPHLTFVLTGLKYGQTAAVLSSPPKLSTSATASSAVGDYPISVDITASTAANYTLTLGTAASITVKPATLQIKALGTRIHVGDPIPPFLYAFSGFVNGDTSSIVTGKPTLTTTAVQGSPAGNYPIMVSVQGVSAPNYVVAPGPDATLTIVP